MDGYSRRMIMLVFCAFCLMIPAVLRINSNFNTIVEPPTTNLILAGQRIELPHHLDFQNLKTKLIQNGEQAKDKLLVWWDQVRNRDWESIASKKQEKDRD